MCSGDTSASRAREDRRAPRSEGSADASPPARLLLFLIRFYQWAISPLLGQHCRFYPSCSSYTATAVGRFGALRGAWLGFRRLLRCHPLNPGGVDHVPPRVGD